MGRRDGVPCVAMVSRSGDLYSYIMISADLLARNLSVALGLCARAIAESQSQERYLP